ncbi:Mov34/MPN/PAD-1 family protein [Aquabacterium sp.]|uniref:Mov34/MPN/PAD-1 family protein n=1 Tax=Aquabacterium sp. TaxID=1872578 RepID=UPI0035C73969
MDNAKVGASCRVAGAAWALTFTSEVLQLIGTHAQRGRVSRESVGQLYCRDLTTANIVVGHATALPRTRAFFTGVQFNPAVAMEERTSLFQSGWHCVGLWHSHPESHPQPSSTDAALAKDHATAAATHLNGLVFAILGTQPLPEGLSVWLHDGARFSKAEWEL